LDYNTLRIPNFLEITGAIRGDVTQVRVRKSGVKDVKCGVPCVEHEGLLAVSASRLDGRFNLLIRSIVFIQFSVTNLTQHFRINLSGMHLINIFIVTIAIFFTFGLQK